jgi:SnoaL-like domain
MAAKPKPPKPDWETSARALERRLRALEDVESIRRLKARYGRLVDGRYGDDGPLPRGQLEALADEIAALFAKDAVWDGGQALGTCRGRDEIRRRMAEPTLRFSWHYFVKPEIEVDGDRARGRWDLLAPCTTREGRAMWMAGVEEDDYVREDGTWLHARMQLRVVFFAPHERGWAPPR